MSQSQKCIVHYQVATYSGDLLIYCDSDDDSEHVMAMAKRELIRQGGGLPLPLGYQRFTITSREDYHGE